MATGFQVINDNGILQIDEFFQNMVLVQKGTITTARPGGTGSNPYPQAYYADISYPVSARQPVIAIRSSSNVCFLTRDNAFTFFSFPGAVTVEYFIYDRIAFGNASGNVGFQVFNAQGIEVFNSNNNYMKVLGSYDINLVASIENGAPTPEYAGSAQFGRKLAVCMSVQSTGWHVASGGTPQQPSGIIRWWQAQCRTPSDNTYVISNSIISIFGGPVNAGNQGAIGSYSSGLIIDVTGI